MLATSEALGQGHKRTLKEMEKKPRCDSIGITETFFCYGVIRVEVTESGRLHT